MKLICNKIEGFVSTSPEILIEKNGKLFYFNTRKKTGRISFNLPAGQYEITVGSCQRRPRIHYPLIPLPKFDFNDPIPNKIDVIYTDNKHKCSVDTSKKSVLTVYLDNSFKGVPEFVTDYILGHESAHFKYRKDGLSSEINCDLFSANMMLQTGMNPSQVDAAIRYALGDKMISEHRKEGMYKVLDAIQTQLHKFNHLEND